MCDQFPVQCSEGHGEEVPRNLVSSHFLDIVLIILLHQDFGQ